MFRVIFFGVLIVFINYSTGVEWVTRKSGDYIPTNAVLIHSDYSSNCGQKYVGRARHFDEILPAEVNNTCAVVHSCGKEFIKNRYEVLVDGEKSCYWNYIDLKEIPLDIKRGGTGANGEPIFIGRHVVNVRTFYTELDLRDAHMERCVRIKALYLTSDRHIHSWDPDYISILRCEDNDTWIDTPAARIPCNAVSGGKSKDGNDMFVGRLKSSCSIIPGQVIPDLGLAMATHDGEDIESPFCQVLKDEFDQYSWMSSSDGDIPENAVVGSRHPNGELMYVSRLNGAVGYIIHSSIANTTSPYEILVKN